MRALQCGDNSTGERNMIVLNQDSVGKIQAMVLPAAATHRVFIDHPQPRDRLPGIEDSGFSAGHSLDELTCERCNSAHTLQEIQDHALDTDRKSTRLNSSHGYISYAVFCLKKNINSAPAHVPGFAALEDACHDQRSPFHGSAISGTSPRANAWRSACTNLTPPPSPFARRSS